MFDHNNCRRCPILGQSEISGAEGRTRNALWAVHSGYFFPPESEKPREDEDEGDEGWDEEERTDKGRAWKKKTDL